MEGTQAARSADYAIHRFHHIRRLLVVHGRYSLIRNSSLLHYSIYKNACFALGQYWFAFFCGYSGQRIYNDWMMLFFNIFFTSVPTLFVAVFEKDIKEEILMKIPEAYKELKEGHLFNKVSTAMWLINAVWHSLVIFFTTYFIVRHDIIWVSGKTADLWTMGYYIQTYAILVILFKLAYETKYWVFFTHMAVWGSMICYFAILGAQSILIDFFSPEYYVFENALKSIMFVLILLLILSVSFIYDIILTWISRNHFTRNWHILQEKTKQSKKGNLCTAEMTEESPLLSKK